MAGNNRRAQFVARTLAQGSIGTDAINAGVRNARQLTRFIENQKSADRISTTRAFALVSEIVKKLPDRFDVALIDQLRAIEPEVLARVKQGVPRRKSGPPARNEKWRASGGLRSLLTSKLDEKERRVSFGLLTKEARASGFYGYILDAGRGQKNKVSRPRSRYLGIAASLVKGFQGLTRGRYSKSYTRKISPIAPAKYDITFGRVREFARNLGGPLLLRAYDKVLGEILWSGRT